MNWRRLGATLWLCAAMCVTTYVPLLMAQPSDRPGPAGGPVLQDGPGAKPSSPDGKPGPKDAGAPILADLTPAPDDGGGISVDSAGSVLHRATGPYEPHENDKRTAVFCWIEPAANAVCTDFAIYQFVCVTVASVDYGSGWRPPRHPPPKDEKHTGNGSKLRFNGWEADDYPNDPRFKSDPGKEVYKKKPMEPNAHERVQECTEPSTRLEAGPYAGPYDIPGLPALGDNDTAAQLRRLIDAPDLAIAPVLVDRLYAHLCAGDDGLEGPGDKPGTRCGHIKVRIVFHFRDALYCKEDCLGRWGWHVEETLAIDEVWRKRRAVVDVGLGSNGGRETSEEGWVLGGTIASRVYGTPVFGPFVPCPGHQKQPHPVNDEEPPKTKERDR